jgi:hypothetical protein
MPVREAVDAAAAVRGVARWIGLQHHTVDRRLEITAVAQSTRPDLLVDALPGDALPDGEPTATAGDLLSYLVGAAFGRWDVRVGANPSAAPPRPAPLAPVPVCPPGQLTGADGFPAETAPCGYPLTLPPDRLLLDELGHRWDILGALHAAAAVIHPDPDSLLDEIALLLGGDLRAHLRRRFFRGHRTRYSKSRRTAPLYWPLTVPSRQWSVWVYASTIRRETLFAVAGAAADRRARAESEILRLQRERASGGAGRSSREVMTALVAEQELATELAAFHTEATRVASSGWTPDLDDGIVINAAPLADLFPDWPDLASTRQDLRAGKLPWCTAHQWRAEL